MAAKPAFSDDQLDVLYRAAKRVRGKFKTQEEMALALGITQGSVSALLLRKWAPGIRVAQAIANLNGEKLEDLVGPLSTGEEEAPVSEKKHKKGGARFPNLEVCVQFHHGAKGWSEWTIAAAEAGFFGPSDFPPPAWAGKLDTLEKALERVRKSGS